MMRRFLSLMAISVIIQSLTSCSERLDEDITASDHQLIRYLSYIEEYLLPNNYWPEGRLTRLFNEPEYDEEGRIRVAYVDFTGIPANHVYTYSDDQIILRKNCMEDEDYSHVYTLKDGRIISCHKSSYDDLKPGDEYYEFSYDEQGYLSEIRTYQNEDLEHFISVAWKDGNMISTTKHLILYDGSVYPIITEYSYKRDKKYKGAFMAFYLQFDFFGVYGVDEILAGQGYFGHVISKDIVVTEDQGGGARNDYKVELDKNGNISKVFQLSKTGKAIREYRLIWR